MPNKPTVRGDTSYLHQKLGQAIDGAMFTSDPDDLIHVFHSLTLGIDDVERSEGKKAALLDTENAQDWFAKIKSLIKPTEADKKHPSASDNGEWWVVAKRMTRDQKRDLARCIWELYNHVGDVGRD